MDSMCQSTILLIPDDGGSTHLWNVGRQSFYTAVYPRRQLWIQFYSSAGSYIPVTLFWRVLTMVWSISKNLAYGLYPSSSVFCLKTTFRKLAVLPSSGKKGEKCGTYSVGSLRASLNHWADQLPKRCLLKKKTFDDGYSPKARLFCIQ
jgi:hypothetical protein